MKTISSQKRIFSFMKINRAGIIFVFYEDIILHKVGEYFFFYENKSDRYYFSLL